MKKYLRDALLVLLFVFTGCMAGCKVVTKKSAINAWNGYRDDCPSDPLTHYDFPVEIGSNHRVVYRGEFLPAHGYIGWSVLRGYVVLKKRIPCPALSDTMVLIWYRYFRMVSGWLITILKTFPTTIFNIFASTSIHRSRVIVTPIMSFCRRISMSGAILRLGIGYGVNWEKRETRPFTMILLISRDILRIRW
jgi:hypothetical protein